MSSKTSDHGGKYVDSDEEMSGDDYSYDDYVDNNNNNNNVSEGKKTEKGRGLSVNISSSVEAPSFDVTESLFIKAIQTENAVVLLDELSRAHPDAWNILMTVLDEGQRYIRLDEADGQATIKVAKGVTFVATANIGNEYTSTRVMDKALMDRFIIVEMDVLNDTEEVGLLSYLYPNVDPELLKAVSEIAHSTRVEASSEDGKFASGVSTRTSVEMAGLLFDGFGLDEAAEVCVYPQFDSSGGADSERTFIKQLVQKYVSDGSDENLFNEEEVNETEAEYAS